VNRFSRSFSHLPVVALITFAGAGCVIPFEEPGVQQVNSCQVASDCGPDSTCAVLDTGSMCVSTKSDLAGVVFEIRPGAASPFGANTSHLIDLGAQGVPLQGQISGPIPFDPALPALVNISPGRINCVVADGMSSVQAKVELNQISLLTGITDKSYTTSSEPEDPQSGTEPSFAFKVDVPPGIYDIYVTPEPNALCDGAPLPPVFIPGSLISVNSTFQLDVVKARNLIGEIVPPSDLSLDGWLLDVIEQNTGRLISTVQTINHKTKGTSPLINLHYNFTDLTGLFTPFVRLRPPPGVIAPSVFWNLAAADLSNMNKVKLEIPDLATTPVNIEGHVLDKDQFGVISSVTLQSVGLSAGTASRNAAYMVVVDTNAHGFFKTQVPPGNYRVIAKPFDETKSLAEVIWPVDKGPDNCFCGQVVTVPDRAILAAKVETPVQGPLLAAEVVASPSIPPPITQVDRELGLAPTLPRDAKVDVVGGEFELGVDLVKELFDLSVRPPVLSGYPWLVRSRLAVQPAKNSPATSLGVITIGHPVVVGGVVRDPFGNIIPGATLRVWVPVKSPEGLKNTVVKIAETSTDQYGRYTVLLPASISQ
jgi:hypothetical protein